MHNFLNTCLSDMNLCSLMLCSFVVLCFNNYNNRLFVRAWYVKKRIYSDSLRFLLIRSIPSTSASSDEGSWIKRFQRQNHATIISSFPSIANEEIIPKRRYVNTILETFKKLSRYSQNSSSLSWLLLPGNNLDIYLLASLAEIAQVDFRIIILNPTTWIPPNTGLATVTTTHLVTFLYAQLASIDQSFLLRAQTPQKQDINFFEQLNSSSFNKNVFITHLKPYIALVQEIIQQRKKQNNYLQKRIFNDKIRFIFIAGLEGSGHHALREMFEACHTQGLCITSAQLMRALSNGREHPIGISVYPKDTNTTEINQRRNNFISILKQMATKFSDTSNDTLIILNTMIPHKTEMDGITHSGGIGMQSYPNFNGKQKIYNHPSIQDIARAAENAKVDLRILVLARPSKAILRSTTKNRHIATESTETLILAHNAAILSAQLQLIDPRFYICMPYLQLANYSFWLASHVAQFLHPTFLQHPSLLRAFLAPVHLHSSPTSDVQESLFVQFTAHDNTSSYYTTDDALSTYESKLVPYTNLLHRNAQC